MSIHFVRPEWFLAAIPAILALWLMFRTRNSQQQWLNSIADHLRPFLVLGADDARHGRLPLLVTGLIWLMVILGMAGPAFDRLERAGATDEGILVVALDLSNSMLAADIQPSRIDRSKQKLDDLLSRRAGSKTALIAFAGTAHIVVPAATDMAAVRHQLASLSPDIMPVQGTDLAGVSALADSLISSAGASGTILLISDGVDNGNVDQLAWADTADALNLIVWAVGTTTPSPMPRRGGFVTQDGQPVLVSLDVGTLGEVESWSGAEVVRMTVDNSDVDRIVRSIQTSFERRGHEAEADWLDRGYWLIIPVLLLASMWFRKGWFVQWIWLIVMTGAIGGCSLEQDRRLNDLWFSRDQQGQILFDRGEIDLAANRFETPIWRGIASFEAGKLDEAISEFEQVGTAEGFFNAGNVHVAKEDTIPTFRWRQRISELRRAIAAYDVALSIDDGFEPATVNKSILNDEIAAIQSRFVSAGDTDVGADDVVQDEEDFGDGKDSSEEQGEQQDEGGQQQAGAASQTSDRLDQSPTLTQDNATDMLTRLVNDDPSVFLRTKFRFQVEQAGRPPDTDKPW